MIKKKYNYNREYYINNREKIIKQNKEYTEKHKEEKKIYYREYGQKNKEILYAKAKIRNKKNKEHIAERMKKWNEDNKEHVRSYFIQKKYGLSTEEYKNIIENNKGLCPICKSVLVFGVGVRDPKAATIDHNHETGKVRDVLCSNCNMGIGKFKENIITIQAALDYLKKHNI